MKGNELVWRTLLDATFNEQREWNNVGDVAFQAGVPVSTAYLALERLTEIGAVKRYSSGLVTVNPEKVLTLLCAWRNLATDTIAKTTRTAIDRLLDPERRSFALGGAEAAIAHLGGVTPVLGYTRRIVYLRATEALKLPPGDDVTVLAMDRRAERAWNGVTSVAQTMADLFATPGWQATEFRLALRDQYLPARDWHQKGEKFG